MLQILAAVLFLLVLLINPAICIQGASAGLLLWYQQVIPALFPSMLVTSYLISRSTIQKKLQQLPIKALVPLLTGLLCGSPMGAKVCCDLEQNRLFTKREAILWMGLVQMPSPLFLFGYTANATLGLEDPLLFGLAAYLPVLILSALILCFGNSFGHKKRKAVSPVSPVNQNRASDIKQNKKETEVQPDIETVCDSCLELLIRVGILIMFFSILGELLHHWLPSSLGLELIVGMLEMTTGINHVCTLVLPQRLQAALCLFLIGYGGFCVHLQVMQAWKNHPFPWLYYELMRLLLGTCSAVCYLFLS